MRSLPGQDNGLLDFWGCHSMGVKRNLPTRDIRICQYIYMCIYICVYVYIYVYIHVFVYIYIYIYVYICICICIYIYIYVYIYIYMYLYIYIYEYVYVYIYVYMYIYICIGIYIYMYVYVYVYIYIYIYVYVYVYMYICIYVYTYIYIYIYISCWQRRYEIEVPQDAIESCYIETAIEIVYHSLYCLLNLQGLAQYNLTRTKRACFRGGGPVLFCTPCIQACVGIVSRSCAARRPRSVCPRMEFLLAYCTGPCTQCVTYTVRVCATCTLTI